MNLATWPVRVGATIVDVIPNIILSVIGSAIGGSISIIFSLLGLGWTIYNRFILGGQGQSWGKKLLGLNLIKEETGQPIGALNAFLRDLAHIVDLIICGVGFLFPLWDAKRQTLADKFLGTLVTKA